VPSARAEIPNQSQEQLGASASHVLKGVVERTYEQKERRGDFEYTHCVAEIAVAQAEKGTEIAAGDRVFVRYWRKRWLAGGNPPPDHYGHRSVPDKSDSVEVYVKGNRKSGFDVVSPNGFFKVSKAKASDPNR
jgi:hypothetical protein